MNTRKSFNIRFLFLVVKEDDILLQNITNHTEFEFSNLKKKINELSYYNNYLVKYYQ